MSFEFPMDPFFDTFGESAMWKSQTGDQAIEVIADFEVDIEMTYGIQFSKGYSGVFDLTESIYNAIQSGDVITLNGRRFEVMRKLPAHSGVYKVAVLS